MKKTGIKQLFIMADEAARAIHFLEKKLTSVIGSRELHRANAALQTRQKAHQGILEKAKAYGTGDTIFKITISVEGQKANQHIYYVNVDEDEVNILLSRDLKGLKYRVLEKITEKSAHILS